MAIKRTRGNGQGSLFKSNGKGCWIAQWHDHNGKRHVKSTRTTDKAAAKRILDKYVADVALRREGVIDPELDAFATEGRRPIERHFDDYKAYLRSRYSLGHTDTVIGRIEKVLSVAKIKILSDLKPLAIERALAEIMEDRKLGAQTRNDYLTAMKAFANWLVRMRRLPLNPIAPVERLPVVETEHRRALTVDEAQRLIEAATHGPIQRGLTEAGLSLARRGLDLPAEHVRWEMTGPDRALLYRFTLETALRRGAIERLLVSDFDLDEQPTVTAQATINTKNSRKLVIPLRPATARFLSASFAERLPSAKAFDMPRCYETARMIRTDLAAARRAWIDEGQDPDERAKRAESDYLAERDSEGRTLDFHALRTTCSTWLDQAGISASLASRITGHTNVNTLQKHYHRMNMDQTRRAVESLPDLAGTGTEPHDRFTGDIPIVIATSA